MKVRDYFINSAQHSVKAVVMLAKGVYYFARHLFTNYPNPTWMVISSCIILACFVLIGNARSERDHYSKTCIELQLKIDSLTNKQIKYAHWEL